MLKIRSTTRQVVFICLLIVLSLPGEFPTVSTAHAQDATNLLVNGGMEEPYFGSGSSTRTVPQGWNLVVLAGAPDAFPHRDPLTIPPRQGTAAWNIKQGYVAFTAVAYQQVSGLKAGQPCALRRMAGPILATTPPIPALLKPRPTVARTAPLACR